MFIDATPDIFAFRLSATADLTVLRPLADDPEDFVVTHVYDVLGSSEEQDSIELGQVEVQTVLLGQALNEDMAFAEVMDTSQDLLDIYAQMFDPAFDDELDDAFVAALGDGGSSNGIAYVPSDEILDFNWGPSVLRTLVQHSPCSFFVVGVSGLVCKEDTAQERAQAEARAAKLESMGFVRYAGGPFFYLNLDYQLAPLPKALQFPAQECVVAGV